MSSTSVNSTASQDSLNFDDSLAETAGLTKSHSNLEICSMSEQDYINSSVQETRSLSEMDNLTIRISPEKVINLPSLTEAQVKSITGKYFYLSIFFTGSDQTYHYAWEDYFGRKEQKKTLLTASIIC